RLCRMPLATSIRRVLMAVQQAGPPRLAARGVGRSSPMSVPLVARCVAAAFGAAFILGAWASAIGTLIVPRQVASRLTRWVERVVVTVYWFVTRRMTDFRRVDRILATQVAAILIIQLFTWMALAFCGFTLLLWPWAKLGIASAFSDAGSSMFTLGYDEPAGAWPAAVVFAAAMYLALSPKAAPTVPARLCLRGGFECLTRIAQ